MTLQRISTGTPREKTVLHGPGTIVSGRVLHTSGLVARDAAGKPVGAGDMGAQIVQVFRNMADVLRAAGTDFSRVVKYTIYVTDIEAFQRARAVADEFFVGKPSSTLIEVSRLAAREMMVEVEAVVALD